MPLNCKHCLLGCNQKPIWLQPRAIYVPDLQALPTWLPSRAVVKRSLSWQMALTSMRSSSQVGCILQRPCKKLSAQMGRIWHRQFYETTFAGGFHIAQTSMGSPSLVGCALHRQLCVLRRISGYRKRRPPLKTTDYWSACAETDSTCEGFWCWAYFELARVINNQCTQLLQVRSPIRGCWCEQRKPAGTFPNCLMRFKLEQRCPELLWLLRLSSPEERPARLACSLLHSAT
eukprot:scaffold4702_cov18-Tisochrysis_lutea.AAC.1